MSIMQSNEKILNFRVRSIEKRFAKTNSFSHSKSTASKQKLPYLKLKSMCPYVIKRLPATTMAQINPDLKNYKRIMPKTLHIPRPNSKKCSVDKKQTKAKHSNTEPKISISYDSLLFQDHDSTTQCPNKAYWPNGGSLIVVKQISCLNHPSCNIFNETNHPRIMQYLDIEYRNSSIFLYSQYNQNGNLQSLINSFGTLSQALIKKITKQLIESVQYIVQKKITINLKSSKILVDQNSDIKLIVATKKDKENELSNVGIRQAIWTPVQELLGRKSQQEARLIWKIGCIVLHMATGKNPWCYRSVKTFTNTAQFLNLVACQKAPVLPQQGSKRLLSFLNSCFEQNPQNRSSLPQLKNSPFLSPI